MPVLSVDAVVETMQAGGRMMVAEFTDDVGDWRLVVFCRAKTHVSAMLECLRLQEGITSVALHSVTIRSAPEGPSRETDSVLVVRRDMTLCVMAVDVMEVVKAGKAVTIEARWHYTEGAVLRGLLWRGVYPETRLSKSGPTTVSPPLCDGQGNTWVVILNDRGDHMVAVLILRATPSRVRGVLVDATFWSLRPDGTEYSSKMLQMPSWVSVDGEHGANGIATPLCSRQRLPPMPFNVMTEIVSRSVAYDTFLGHVEGGARVLVARPVILEAYMHTDGSVWTAALTSGGPGQVTLSLALQHLGDNVHSVSIRHAYCVVRTAQGQTLHAIPWTRSEWMRPTVSEHVHCIQLDRLPETEDFSLEIVMERIDTRLDGHHMTWAVTSLERVEMGERVESPLYVHPEWGTFRFLFLPHATPPHAFVELVELPEGLDGMALVVHLMADQDVTLTRDALETPLISLSRPGTLWGGSLEARPSPRRLTAAMELVVKVHGGPCALHLSREGKDVLVDNEARRRGGTLGHIDAATGALLVLRWDGHRLVLWAERLPKDKPVYLKSARLCRHDGKEMVKSAADVPEALVPGVVCTWETLSRYREIPQKPASWHFEASVELSVDRLVPGMDTMDLDALAREIEGIGKKAAPKPRVRKPKAVVPPPPPQDPQVEAVVNEAVDEAAETVDEGASEAEEEEKEEEPEEEPLDAFVCPISLSIMADPVMAGDCHTYERVAIEAWIQKATEKKLPICSPVTGLVLPRPIVLLPNVTMRKAIEEWRAQQHQVGAAP